ncbi:XdhC family protein [Streptomyces sp. NPDC004393]|uniref:XdhC family protein n=1 Tax=Streptomyces sp. NPDC004533 TaxID=3154278 RepID=UPI0033AEE36D
MLELAEQLARWCAEGRAFAVATVVSVSGSAPRQPGAGMAVDNEGTVVGSVSGGCVEAAVYEACRAAMASGRSELHRFGYSDEDAFAAGLTCGGSLEVFVRPVDPGDSGEWGTGLKRAAAVEVPAAVASVIAGPPGLVGRALWLTGSDVAVGGFGDTVLDAAVQAEAAAFLEAGRTGTVEFGARGGLCGAPLRLLVESRASPPRMLVFGAVDFAAAVVRVGKFLGCHVTVCDARPVFATAERFPEADEVIGAWPHRYLDTQTLDGRSLVCVLTHDPKFDIPLLSRALRLPVAYVGAMGSRRTHDQRLALLREAGVTDAQLARLHSPIGLDLGARTPEETAVSIAAEIVAVRRGGTGTPLTGGVGPVHRRRASDAARSPRFR